MALVLYDNDKYPDPKDGSSKNPPGARGTSTYGNSSTGLGGSSSWYGASNTAGGAGYGAGSSSGAGLGGGYGAASGYGAGSSSGYGNNRTGGSSSSFLSSSWQKPDDADGGNGMELIVAPKEDDPLSMDMPSYYQDNNVRETSDGYVNSSQTRTSYDQFRKDAQRFDFALWVKKKTMKVKNFFAHGKTKYPTRGPKEDKEYLL